jgi:hypothetical protein
MSITLSYLALRPYWIGTSISYQGPIEVARALCYNGPASQ